MEDKINGLNKLIENAVENGVFPGATYSLIVNKDKYFGFKGYKSLIPEKEDASLDTIYDMASCTKVVATTTAILLLMERGLLRLYDSVSTYLSDFKHNDVTIMHLLTHTSGLIADLPNMKDLSSREEVISKIYALELIYRPGEKIVYSDIGFVLLGLIVEKISSMSLDKFTKENIFNKLEMYDTSFVPSYSNRIAPTEKRDDNVVRGLVRGKVHDETAYAMNGIAGHAGLFSTSKDISNFMEMILNDGIYNGKSFLSKRTIDLLFEVKVIEKDGILTTSNKRGIGWILKGSYPSSGDLVSNNTIMHTGFTGTNIFIDRTNKIAFCMLSNRVHPTRNNTKIISFRGKIGNYIMSNF